MKLKEPYSTLAYIVLGVALAFGINTGLGLLLQTNLPIVAVESNSMVPTFAKGDILILQGSSSYDLRDIIVFTPLSGGTPIVHRIIKINDDNTYQTQGDANRNQLPFEKSITLEQIHGETILTLPYLGWVKIAITDYVLPNILIVAGVAILLYLFTKGPTKGRKKKKRRR